MPKLKDFDKQLEKYKTKTGYNMRTDEFMGFVLIWLRIILSNQEEE